MWERRARAEAAGGVGLHGPGLHAAVVAGVGGEAGEQHDHEARRKRQRRDAKKKVED